MIAQVVILVFGLSSIWFANEKRDSTRRWAPVCGLIAQPAWISSALLTGQIGVLLVSLAYTVMWVRGFHAFWLAKPGPACPYCGNSI